MQPVSQKKTTLTFSMLISIFLLTMSLAGFLLWQVLPTIISIFKLSSLNQAMPLCNCFRHALTLSNHPYLSGLIISLGMLALVFFVLVAISIMKIWVKTVRFNHSVKKRQLNFSTKLLAVATSLDLQDRVMVVDSESLDIYCFGLLKPRICLTTKVIDQVSKRELRAILLHEKNHLVSHDSIKLFFAGIIKQSLFFLPGLSQLLKQFETGIELAADERATNNFQEVQPLSKALVRLIELRQNPSQESYRNVAVNWFSVTNARIDRLLNHNHQINFFWLTPGLVIAIIVIASLFFTLFNSQKLLAKTTQLTISSPASSDLSCPMASMSSEPVWGNAVCQQDQGVSMSCVSYLSEADSCQLG